MIPRSDQSDVLVVGSGIVGIACAHYLKKGGFRVTVVDQGTIAGGCSHANCGYICPSHLLPLTEPGAIGLAFRSLLNPNAPFRVKPRFSPALWKWMLQFARRCNQRQMLAAGVHLKALLDSSIREYRTVIDRERLECEWKENGLLYVLQTERGMQEFSETDRLLTEQFGVSARRIAGSELPAFDGALKHRLAGAFYYEGDASVRPDLLNQSWTSVLAADGVAFVPDCQVHAVEKSDGKISKLKTTHGDMQAAHYVFATGAWSELLSRELECPIPVQPGKGYSVTLCRPKVCPQYPMLFPEHRVGVSPFDDGIRIGSMMEFSGFDTSIPQHRIVQLRKSVEPYLSSEFDDTNQRPWFGWRPMTWDSLPIIGPVPGLAGAYLATGHNMLGLSLATATGKLIAEFMQGIPPHIDPEPFSPERF